MRCQILTVNCSYNPTLFLSYCPARNAIDTHAHSELAHYKLLETLEVFSVCVCAVIEMSVSSTNSSPVVPCIASSSPASSHTSPPFAGITSLSVVCRSGHLADSFEFNISSPEGLDL